MALKDHATIHAKRITVEVHPDHRGNEVAYAWLAITTLEDCRLGTLEEAKRYYEMSTRASSRRIEVYGPRGEEPPVLAVRSSKYATVMNAPEQCRALDVQLQKWNSSHPLSPWRGKHPRFVDEAHMLEMWKERS
jgi:hypothetical protein